MSASGITFTSSGGIQSGNAVVLNGSTPRRTRRQRRRIQPPRRQPPDGHRDCRPVDIGAKNTRIDIGTNTSNRGMFNIDSGAVLSVSGGAIVNNGGFSIASDGTPTQSQSAFTDAAGTLTVNGAMSDTLGTFTSSGGVQSGASVVLSGSALTDGPGGGPFSLRGTDSLQGTVPSGQTVTVQGTRSGPATTHLMGPSKTRATLRRSPT